MGMHGTTPQGIRGIIRAGCMKGSEDHPQTYLLRAFTRARGTRPQAWRCIVRLPLAKTNSCGIIVELTAKRRFQCYSAFRKRPDLTQAEKLLLGTGWDAYISLKKDEIAHYDQKG